MAEQIQIRFRHASGDVGPFPFPPTSTILNLKERVCQEWQTSGTLIEGETPKIGSLKLIFNGKFLEDGKTLSELKSTMGDQAITTFHLVVRPAGSSKSNAVKTVDLDTTPKNCGCTVQ